MIQTVVREQRFPSSTNVAAPLVEVSGTSSSSTTQRGDGIIRPDIVVRTRYDVPHQEPYALVTFVGEAKMATAMRPNARAKAGLAQLFLQLLSAHEAYGTYLASAHTKTRLARVAALGSRRVAVECGSLRHGQTHVLGVAEFLANRCHYDELPHDLSTDEGYALLWRAVADGVELLGRQPLDEPPERLAAPIGPTWSRVRELRRADDIDVVALWATCRDGMRAFKAKHPSYFKDHDDSDRRGSGGAQDANAEDGPWGSNCGHVGDQGRHKRKRQGGDDGGDRGRSTNAHEADGLSMANDAEDEDDDLPLGAEAETYGPGPAFAMHARVLETLGVDVVIMSPQVMDRLMAEARESVFAPTPSADATAPTQASTSTSTRSSRVHDGTYAKGRAGNEHSYEDDEYEGDADDEYDEYDDNDPDGNLPRQGQAYQANARALERLDINVGTMSTWAMDQLLAEARDGVRKSMAAQTALTKPVPNSSSATGSGDAAGGVSASCTSAR